MTAYILNLLDLIFTLHALSHGAVELNPAMRCVPIQMFYKVFVVGALCRWLGRRGDKLARAGLGICTAGYAVVDLWHLINLFLLEVF